MSAKTARKSTRPTSAPVRSNRRLLLVLGVVVIVILVGLIGSILLTPAAPPYVPEVTGRPNAVADTTVIDHGDVKMEDTVQSEFHIRNTGDRPLQIIGEPRVELVQGCCPPRAIVSAMTVNPGEEIVIRLRFTMHEMMGGPHEFRVHVLTNDPTQQEIPLTILSNWIE